MDNKPVDIMLFQGRYLFAHDGEVFEAKEDGTVELVRPDPQNTEPVIVDVKPLSFVRPLPSHQLGEAIDLVSRPTHPTP